MRPLKNLLKALIRPLGYEILPVRIPPPPVLTPLAIKGIDLLFDVGANVGQYAIETRAAGYGGRIVSFEPLPEAHAHILTNSADDPAWLVHDRCAVGEFIGLAEINISENSYSSSLLAITEACVSAAPDAAYVGTASVPIVTLDSVFAKYCHPGQSAFLKIDTQGFEWQVLQGAQASLPNICGVQLELSVKPLYEGQKTYLPLLEYLDDAGFELWELIPGFADPGGQRLQFDAILFRPQ